MRKRQTALFEMEPDVTCAFGEPIAGPHPLCDAYFHRISAQYHADVAAGKYDAEGYTPKERRAQQKKSKRVEEALQAIGIE